LLILVFRKSKKTKISKLKSPSKIKYKIYTKVGDQGKSSLCDSLPIYKNSPCFNLVGNLDELNSFIGNSIEYGKLEEIPENYIAQLRNIQENLLNIGGFVAENKVNENTDFYTQESKILEKYIDEIEEYLEPLKRFLLPSGSLCSTSLHICRSVCRRAEREFVNYLGKDCENNKILPYINRLSDYFFVLARFACKNNGSEETFWNKKGF